MKKVNGKTIICAHCRGFGVVQVYFDGPPGECPDCTGSGHNWRYSGGAIAAYYGGPFLGRE